MTVVLERELSDAERELFDYLEQQLAVFDLADLGPIDVLADRMIAALPDTGAVWGPIVGPVYTSQGLQRWLGISRQAINQHVQGRRILRLTTTDGVSVFPSFQFDSNGGRLPHLSDVLDVLATGVDDPWTWASWLNAPDKAGLTNAARLRNGDWELVRESASEDAAAWCRQ